MADDLSIARAAVLRPVTEVAARLGVRPDELELYGEHNAKIAGGAGAPRRRVSLGCLRHCDDADACRGGRPPRDWPGPRPGAHTGVAVREPARACSA